MVSAILPIPPRAISSIAPKSSSLGEEYVVFAVGCAGKGDEVLESIKTSNSSSSGVKTPASQPPGQVQSLPNRIPSIRKPAVNSILVRSYGIEINITLSRTQGLRKVRRPRKYRVLLEQRRHERPAGMGQKRAPADHFGKDPTHALSYHSFRQWECTFSCAAEARERTRSPGGLKKDGELQFPAWRPAFPNAQRRMAGRRR